METQVLQALLEEPGNVCVSLYAPLFRRGREVQQNQLRVRNLIKDTRALLEQDSIATEKQHAEILARLERFLVDGDHSAWRHPPAGLAVFATPEQLEVHELGIPVPEQVHVGERFYIRPLLPALHSDGRFILVTVSQKQVRLYEGDQDHLEEREVPELPQNLIDALNIDDFITSYEYQAFSNKYGEQAHFHGHGHNDRDQANLLLTFFQRLDPPLREYLEGRDDPLVFAGVEYLYPIFKEAISYPHLLPDSIHGNFDHPAIDELHAKALELVVPHFQQVTSQAIDLFEDAFGQNRATTDLETIMKAAEIGGVENLLILEGASCWGQVDTDGNVQITENPDETSLDLLDELAVETLIRGGDVFVVREEDFPAQGSPVAARLRFELAAVAK